MRRLLWYWLTGRGAAHVFVSFGVLDRVDQIIPLPELVLSWFKKGA